MEEIKKHDDFHDDDNIKKDHYHDGHHILKDGSHDDVQEADFKISRTLKITNKRSLVYHMAATGILLALAVIVSAIDIGFETVEELLTFDGLKVTLRFLDVLVVMLSLGAVGPCFGSIVAFLTPILHASIHNEWSAPYGVLFDSFAYVSTIWILWVIYYVIFRNSPIHVDPNRKKDLIKRYVPIVPFIFVSSLVFSLWFVLTVYVNTKVNPGYYQGDDVDLPSFDELKTNAFVHIVIIYGLNIFRCTIDIAIYTLIEPRMKIINHRYS